MVNAYIHGKYDITISIHNYWNISQLPCPVVIPIHMYDSLQYPLHSLRLYILPSLHLFYNETELATVQNREILWNITVIMLFFLSLGLSQCWDTVTCIYCTTSGCQGKVRFSLIVARHPVSTTTHCLFNLQQFRAVTCNQ